MRRFGAGLLVLAMALGAAGPAVANPLDTFGYTAKGMALGGAMTIWPAKASFGHEAVAGASGPRSTP